MGYVTAVDDRATQWSAEPGLLLYVILAIPLIGLTMLVYAILEWRSRVGRSNTDVV
jgi:hypothetical protein